MWKCRFRHTPWNLWPSQCLWCKFAAARLPGLLRICICGHCKLRKKDLKNRHYTLSHSFGHSGRYSFRSVSNALIACASQGCSCSRPAVLTRWHNHLSLSQEPFLDSLLTCASLRHLGQASKAQQNIDFNAFVQVAVFNTGIRITRKQNHLQLSSIMLNFSCLHQFCLISQDISGYVVLCISKMQSQI